MSTKEAKKEDVKKDEVKNVVEDKRKALQQAINGILDSYGKGAIMTLGGRPVEKVPTISSGCLMLDRALGVGGIPKGRIVEIYGPESSGKTTMALAVIAEAQKLGGTAAFVDAEHSLDISLAASIGVNVDSLLFSQPEYGEQALEIVESLVRSGGVDVIVVDSVSALTPKSEIEGEMGAATMGVQARLMSQALRKLTAAVAKSNTILIFINQLRMKIGVLYGNPETTTGGNALKFYASVRLDVRIIERLKVGNDVVGNLLRVKVVKNKVAPPFREATLQLFFGKGIDHVHDILTVGVENGVIERAGSWYSYEGTRLGQGLDAVRELCDNDPKFFEKIQAAVRKSLVVKEPAVKPVEKANEK